MEKTPAVLLDDDSLIRSFWSLTARKAGVPLQVFEDRESFLAGISGIDRGTVIYIDAQLGGNVRGEDVAKEAHTLGFTAVYLCTGLPAEALEPCPWVLGVLGKDPPWKA